MYIVNWKFFNPTFLFRSSIHTAGIGSSTTLKCNKLSCRNMFFNIIHYMKGFTLKYTYRLKSASGVDSFNAKYEGNGKEVGRKKVLYMTSLSSWILWLEMAISYLWWMMQYRYNFLPTSLPLQKQGAPYHFLTILWVHHLFK